MKKVLYYILLGCMLAAVLPACTDDPLMDGGGEIPEGETTLSAVVNFKPFGEALTGKSRSAGDAIKSIDNLCVLFYADVEGADGKTSQQLVHYKYYKTGEFDVEETPKNITTTNKEHQAEQKTPHATFNLTIPYGKYYAYVVANMGDLNEKYHADIQTPEGLKSIGLTWQYPGMNQNAGEEETTTTETYEDCVKKNNQMFGYFTTKETTTRTYEETNENDKFAAPPLIIDKAMTLHAWIRRAASKVTIAYDGTGLEEGVFVFIRSVTIKDIPASCLLGTKNTVTDKETLIKDGENIVYVPNTDATGYEFNPETYPACITKGQPYYPYTNDEDGYHIKADAHTETSNALFFYENMQGTGQSKKQVWENTPPGQVQFPTGKDEDGNYQKDDQGNIIYTEESYKDQKPCGTYIEVKAYYRSINDKRVGEGNIIYRFMLGKDTDKDYDAERNYHYKLTMKFKHFANDVDWHIEYDEPIPSIQVPDYYISYLYNHSMILPVKVNGGLHKVKDLKAEIIYNNWAPNGVGQPGDTYSYWTSMDPAKDTDSINSTRNRPWNGFLSLRKTKTTTFLTQQKPDYNWSLFNIENKGYYGMELTDKEKEDLSAKVPNYNFEEEQKHPRGNRSYSISPNTDTDNTEEQDGVYTVRSEDEGKTVTFNVPFYTRAKQLVIQTAYTGNNPYVAYPRKARVRFTATLDNNETVVNYSNITQVRRIVNPKGIWREHGTKNTKFHVVLKRLPYDNATTFERFTSIGPWKAYVIRGNKDNFITLSGKVKSGDEVMGSTGTPIDFTINFNNNQTDKSKSSFAIIRVDYHNYSCNHLIFVRQGKEPVALFNGGRKWHASNMVTRTEEAECPLQEGSLFKFGNWDQPIASSNNQINAWGTTYTFPDDSNKDFVIAGATENDTPKKWSEITSSSKNGAFEDVTIDGKTVSVANHYDYEDLFQRTDIEEGFGVLYGNDATETLNEVSQVYGHYHSNDADNHAGTSGYGMRGVFVYNSSEDYEYGGRNLFFPVGTSGYGHRKDSRWENGKRAVLRYACLQTAPMTVEINNRPIFRNLYMRPGAIYWLQKRATGSTDDHGNTIREKDAIAWDFNYFTFDFNAISATNIFGNDSQVNTSDACFIRCVED